MATVRAQQLKNLAASLPSTNQRVAGGLDAARQTQLQETIKQAAPQQAPGAAQQLSAALQQQAGQQTLKLREQEQQQLGRLGQQGLALERQEQATRLQERERGLSRLGNKIANDLDKIDRNAKRELIDRQLEFRRDQSNRVLMSERQLADFAAMSAKSEIEFKNRIQTMEQANQRVATIYQEAANGLKKSLQRGYLVQGQALNQASKQRIVNAIRAAEEKARKKKAKANSMLQMGNALGTLAGIGVGIATVGVGAPATAIALGASAGATGGGALGQMFGASQL